MKLEKNFAESFVYIRNKKINERNKLIEQESLHLKNWIISIEQPFWNEFKEFKNLILSFKHSK